MSKEIKIIVAGAGCRGTIYALQAIEQAGVKVVGVAEPRDEYRQNIIDKCNVPPENVFHCWSEMAAREKFADAVIIATQDCMHKEPAIAFANKGYHILLEKPMAPNAEDCKAIVNAARKNNIILAVCHVLRYTRYTQMLKEVVDSGEIGDIVSIEHTEPVGFWHQAHSFVRGNWRNSKESSPMLLQKSCHDLDWIRYIMNCKCHKVSSFGSLYHFRKEHKPAGAADYCFDCPVEVESNCPYSARFYYLNEYNNGSRHWPLDVVALHPTRESLCAALKKGQYGRCVFSCDNDVVDHQVVNMEFDGGRTASFTMTAFTHHGGRQTTIYGTRGQLIGDSSKIEIRNFLTRGTRTIDTNATDGNITGGHGGGDSGVVDSFLAAVRDGDPSKIITGPDVSLESHLMVFAAEEARAKDEVIRI